MNNFILLQALDIISDAIQLTYQAGQFTRHTILPFIVMCYVYWMDNIQPVVSDGVIIARCTLIDFVSIVRNYDYDAYFAMLNDKRNQVGQLFIYS